MAEKNHTPLEKQELDRLLAAMAEKAEHTPKAKDQALKEVLRRSRRNNRNLLVAVVIGLVILGVLFYFAVRKYYSQF